MFVAKFVLFVHNVVDFFVEGQQVIIDHRCSLTRTKRLLQIIHFKLLLVRGLGVVDWFLGLMLSHRRGGLGYLLLLVLCRWLSGVAPLGAFLLLLDILHLDRLSLWGLWLGLGLSLQFLLLRNVLVWEVLLLGEV